MPSPIHSMLLGSSSHRVERWGDIVAFRPVTCSVEALATFQHIAQWVRRNNGKGYRVHREYDAKGLVESIWVKLLEEQRAA